MESAQPAAQIQRRRSNEASCSATAGNELAQRYAVYSDLWRKKRVEYVKKSTGARRMPLLAVAGVRPEGHEARHKVYGVSAAAAALGSPRQKRAAPSASSVPTPEAEDVDGRKALFALAEAKRKPVKTSAEASTASRHSCRRKPNRSASNTAAMPSRSPSKCKDGDVKLKGESENLKLATRHLCLSSLPTASSRIRAAVITNCSKVPRFASTTFYFSVSQCLRGEPFLWLTCRAKLLIKFFWLRLFPLHKVPSCHRRFSELS